MNIYKSKSCCVNKCTPPLSFKQQPLAPYDIEFTARIMVENKGSMDKWRAARFCELRSLIDQYSSLSEAIENLRSRNSKRVSSHLNLASHAILGESICWPDVALRPRSEPSHWEFNRLSVSSKKDIMPLVAPCTKYSSSLHAS
jgi:hypothetical protein